MSRDENKNSTSSKGGRGGSRPRKTTGSRPENHFHKTGESDGRPRGKGSFRKTENSSAAYGEKRRGDFRDKPFDKKKSVTGFGDKRKRPDGKGASAEERKNQVNFGGKERSFDKPERKFGKPWQDFNKATKPSYQDRKPTRELKIQEASTEVPAFKKFGKKPISEETIKKSQERQVGLANPAKVEEKSFFKKIPKKIQEKIESNTKDEAIRLNRYIANSGLCSRREADELISAGVIKVNGKVVDEMGFMVQPGDTVKYGKDILSREKMMYVLLNKPKDFITTMDDPEERRTVMELVAGACKERIYPVGRLDRNTTGLLLLTNDGELTAKLTHPSSDIKKIYQAELNKPISEADFETLKAGVELEDGFIQPDELAIVTPDAFVVGIKIHSGKNRIVRRMFEHLGYEVTKLDRTTFADLNKKDLPRGNWRFLTEKEIIRLKYMI